MVIRYNLAVAAGDVGDVGAVLVAEAEVTQVLCTSTSRRKSSSSSKLQSWLFVG